MVECTSSNRNINWIIQYSDLGKWLLADQETPSTILLIVTIERRPFRCHSVWVFVFSGSEADLSRIGWREEAELGRHARLHLAGWLAEYNLTDSAALQIYRWFMTVIKFWWGECCSKLRHNSPEHWTLSSLTSLLFPLLSLPLPPSLFLSLSLRWDESPSLTELLPTPLLQPPDSPPEPGGPVLHGGVGGVCVMSRAPLAAAAHCHQTCDTLSPAGQGPSYRQPPGTTNIIITTIQK